MTAPSPTPDAALTEEERRPLGCQCWRLDDVWHHERNCPVPAVERILSDRLAEVEAERDDLRAVVERVMLVAEAERIDTTIIEWAIQCHTRDGDLHTGRPHTSKREARASGERLARINGAEWWLVTRSCRVTVETTPWLPAEHEQGEEGGQ